HRVARRRSENAVDGTIVIAKLQLPRLNGLDCDTISCCNVIARVVVIVRANVRVVIVRVVVVSVIGEVIPWEIPIIQSPPETVVKDKEATMIEMYVSTIPVAVPISVVTFSNVVIDPPVHTALRKCLRWASD